MAVPELAPAGVPVMHLRAGRGVAKIFRVRFARQWLNPLSKFLDPPLECVLISKVYVLISGNNRTYSYEMGVWSGVLIN